MSHDSLIKLPIEDIVGERFGRYSKYIIQERALPDVRDGLKPVQRRILYAMYHDKNFYDKPYRKSAKTVGLVIGNYHPHGDSSVYEAMVRMSQSWKMNMPLIDMQGNNGSIDDDPAAAMRYTEARISKLSQKLLENIDEDVVPFVLNFDDMTTEPSVLPARYPNLLVNGSTGIAAGYATNIPPFNLNEIMDASIYRLHNPECGVDEIMTMVQGPDFPTGAIIQGRDGIEDIIRKGKGRIVVRAKADIVENKSMKQIVITELPYEVIKSNVVRKIDELRFTKASEGFGDVMDVRDESDRTGLRIVIDCKRDANVESILNLFYKYTELQVYYNANMVAIVDQRPQVCGLLEILDAYLKFRQEVVLNRSKYRYEQKEKRLHILEGLMKATSILDEIIAVIRRSNNRSESRNNIMAEFGFTEAQATAIVDLQLYRLSSTDINALRDEFAKLANELEYLDLVINNIDMLNNLIVKEFMEIKETFDTPRKSSIEAEISELEVDHLSLITNEAVMVTVSRDGYLKKVSLRSYGSSQKDVIALMDEDMPVFSSEVETTDYLVFVTSKGRYGMILVHEIDEARWRDTGSHINQYMKCDPNEKIISVFTLKSFDTYQFIVTSTASGMVKKTAISELEVKRTNRLYDVMKLGKHDELVGAVITSNEDHLLLVSKEGQCMRLDLSEINPIGLRAKGVIGMKLKLNDRIVSTIGLSDESDVVFVSDRFQMKRIKAQDIAINNRATQGTSIVKTVKSNPHYLGEVFVGNIQDHILIYNDHTSIISIKDVPIMSSDATFSTVTDEKDFSILRPLVHVVKVAFPKSEAKSIDEPLKLDL
ncbi:MULTISPECIES: DNA topoisomerase IV subunit A [unclassified Erysipelothrix]|uniref:DNA topoisomerase IV subunit A n=1 Tax=unclassified Erysipelothrix TaxID=2624170 RepID=UPI001378835F|nr:MULTISPECIES: DNA topoisomerase IV subunit A [unclassified Erysipelothrix]MBK2402388.1 DNA topoisomerase IV subunit A [Erysipelothrix sp. strain 2 (EsS2-6-Brazil)]MBK2403439.1 DNA topoisomerase IV subunit A [Erysipelothrix sp. strain 2 (EsS2-7-Brazil)]NBA00593.1 DNA topoisomerase IV subunit A [Erysipelothrix rhusiopathiae]